MLLSYRRKISQYYVVMRHHEKILIWLLYLVCSIASSWSNTLNIKQRRSTPVNNNYVWPSVFAPELVP